MSIEDVIRAMVRQGIRRLLVEGKPDSLITDRAVTAALFDRKAPQRTHAHEGRLPPLTVGTLT